MEAKERYCQEIIRKRRNKKKSWEKFFIYKEDLYNYRQGSDGDKPELDPGWSFDLYRSDGRIFFVVNAVTILMIASG